jgi:hypothetical protein
MSPEGAAVLNALYGSTRNWLSKIEFEEDEIRIFKNLSSRYLSGGAEDTLRPRIEQVCLQIPQFEKQKNIVLDKLFCHQSNLKATMEGMMNLSEEYLLFENIKVAETVNDLQDSFNDLRQQLFNLNVVRAGLIDK